jgi:hypothetical protein
MAQIQQGCIALKSQYQLSLDLDKQLQRLGIIALIFEVWLDLFGYVSSNQYIRYLYGTCLLYCNNMSMFLPMIA